MADDGSSQQGTVWPSQQFQFQVEIAGEVAAFQEVSGLEVESETPGFPGVSRLEVAGSITMKRGIATRGGVLLKWFSQLQMNVARKATVTISLLDETGAPLMAWTLANAWPARASLVDPGSADEVAIEELEFRHEGVTAASA